jgi:hypothetical protein
LSSTLWNLLKGSWNALIDQFVRTAGYDPSMLTDLPEEERTRLLAEASVFASGRLMEVEARSHFLDEIHDDGAGRNCTTLDRGDHHGTPI